LGTYDPLAKFQVNWEWNGEPVITQDQANITNSDYEYDANGNIRLQGNRSVSWTTFDKPASMMLIDQDGTQRGSLIEYDAEFNRHYKQEGVLNSLGSINTYKDATYYVGKEYEKIEKQNGDILHRYTINTGGGAIQIERQDGSNKDKPMYMLGDNLGSTNVIINGLGEIEQRLAFDPWGMRTAIPGMDNAVNGVTNRGYTGHEMDDEVGLVNMNARIYDPVLGRFLSADGVLPDAEDMQAFNRYSYVYNNPLKFTDPTGHVPGVHGGNTDVGDQPNSCGYGSGCIRDGMDRYVDEYDAWENSYEDRDDYDYYGNENDGDDARIEERSNDNSEAATIIPVASAGSGGSGGSSSGNNPIVPGTVPIRHSEVEDYEDIPDWETITSIAHLAAVVPGGGALFRQLARLLNLTDVGTLQVQTITRGQRRNLNLYHQDTFYEVTGPNPGDRREVPGQGHGKPRFIRTEESAVISARVEIKHRICVSGSNACTGSI
jgi:RHS repeat-associated protein